VPSWQFERNLKASPLHPSLVGDRTDLVIEAQQEKAAIEGFGTFDLI